jgi:hypothetical protein
VSREPEPEEFEEAPQPPAGEPPVQAPEEFEAAPPPPEGAPPVQGPEEFEPAYPAGAPPSAATVQPPEEFEEAPSAAPVQPPEEFEEAPELRIAKPVQPPEEFEAQPGGGAPPPEAPPPEEFETPGEPTSEASGEPTGEPEAFDVAAEEVEETAPVSLRSAPPAKEGAGRPIRGLTNGLTNGRGGINGRGLTNGRGGINGRGLTNGRGGINGRGLTNGRGRTNGRGLTNGRGRTNGGLTNGRGGVNGRGLTIGRGMVNGRRKGLVNGAGLVDGNGFINGRGLVNGKGLINGQGLTNGRQLTTAEVVPSRPKVRRNMGLIAAALAVALFIIIPVFYYTQVQKGIAIDGIFEDWNGVSNKYDDGDALPSPGTDQNIDITRFGAAATDTDLAVYLEVSGSMLRGANGGVDTLTVFISSGRTGSGYRVNSPGGLLDADYKLEIFGYDGSVRSASYSKFEGANQNDYSGWTSLGAARAAAGGNKLEASIWFQGTDLSRTSDMSVLFYMRNAFGEEDYSDFSIGTTTGVLSIRQRDPVSGGDGATVMLELGAYGSQCTLTSLRVSKAGSAGGGTVTLTGPGVSRDTGFGGTDAILAGLSVNVPKDSKVLLSLNAHGFGGGAFGMYVPGPNAASGLNGSRPVHISVSGYSNVLFYTGGASPGSITIDGAFEDWEATRGQPGWDARGDGSDDLEEPSKAGAPGLVERGGSVRFSDDNVNLQEVAEYNPGGTVYYYARVAGQALGGQVVPASKRGLPGHGGGGGGGKQPDHVGSDVIYVLVDDDGKKDTGYIVRNSEGDPIIGARYCLVVTGKNGQVLESKSYSFDGGWREGGPSIIAAAGGKKVEVAASGLALFEGHKALIIAEDWTGNADRADFTVGATGRSAPGTTLQAMEADASRHAVQVGSSRNPMFQLQLDASGGVVDVQGIELRRDGTAKDTDITAVRLTLDADNDGVFAKTDPEISAAVTFADGKAVFAGAPLITVRPGQRAILFVSIDVSPGATLYSTFGVRASRIDSGADSLDFTNSKATSDIVFAKTGGRYTSYTDKILINEISYDSNGHLQYIELINSYNSKQTISGWKLQYESSSNVYTDLYTFASGTELQKFDNNGYLLSTGDLTGDQIHSGVKIRLTDGSTVMDGPVTPSASSGTSYARARDASNYPTDVWGSSVTSTIGSANALVPEFQDIIIPLMGVISLFCIVRIKRNPLNKKSSEKI